MKIKHCIRAVLFNSHNEILLIKRHDNRLCQSSDSEPHACWLLPGCEILAEETDETVLKRGLSAHLNIVLDRPPRQVWHSQTELHWSSETFCCQQRFYLITLTEDESREAIAYHEHHAVMESRWFSLEQLKQLTDPLLPATLAEALEKLVIEGVPAQPVTIS